MKNFYQKNKYLVNGSCRNTCCLHIKKYSCLYKNYNNLKLVNKVVSKLALFLFKIKKNSYLWILELANKT